MRKRTVRVYRLRCFSYMGLGISKHFHRPPSGNVFRPPYERIATVLLHRVRVRPLRLPNQAWGGMNAFLSILTADRRLRNVP